MVNGPSHNTNMQRWSTLTILALGVGMITLLWTAMTPATAWAYQEDGGGEEAAASEDASASEGGGETAGATDTAEGGDETPQSRSFLGWLIDASGVFGLILLILSFIMVALIGMSVLQIRRDVLLPPDFIDDFEQKLGAKDYQGAYELAKNDDSLVARVLSAGLSKLNRGYNEAIEGMQEVGEDENMALEHRASYLALIGSIAPMIGLMGTVYGMILSFDKIATSETQPKPSELAEGISTALFTTLEGLTVAIPAMIAYSILRNRISRFVLEVGMVSEGLMARFSAVGKQQRSGGGAPASAPASPKE